MAFQPLFIRGWKQLSAYLHILHYMGMWGNILLPFAHFGSRKCRLCGSIAVTLCPDRQYKTVYI